MDDAGRIDDPAHMRALAHPTRLRILGLLRADGPKTAAMLGELIDEAPGTISYHCSRLAAAELIEPAAGLGSDRRERWWRPVHESSSWFLEDALDDPERALAVSALDRAVARTYAANYEAYVDRAASFGRDWVAAGTSADRVVRVTVSELQQLSDELTAVVEKWRARGAEHAEGDGSEQVAVLVQAYRWPRV